MRWNVGTDGYNRALDWTLLLRLTLSVQCDSCPSVSALRHAGSRTLPNSNSSPRLLPDCGAAAPVDQSTSNAQLELLRYADPGKGKPIKPSLCHCYLRRYSYLMPAAAAAAAAIAQISVPFLTVAVS